MRSPSLFAWRGYSTFLRVNAGLLGTQSWLHFRRYNFMGSQNTERPGVETYLALIHFVFPVAYR